MLPKDVLWLVDEVPVDDPADPLTIPEVRRHVAHDRHDDELGLRLLLERPEALAKAWSRDENTRRRSPSHKEAKRRHHRVLRAA